MSNREENLFIRHYLPPISGISEGEEGVSAYFCVTMGNDKFLAEHDCEPKLECDLEEYSKTTYQYSKVPDLFGFTGENCKHIFYLVRANKIDIGRDTEPVLKDIQILFPLVFDPSAGFFRKPSAQETHNLKMRYNGDFLTEDEIQGL